jgi:hypothetical protein
VDGCNEAAPALNRRRQVVDTARGTKYEGVVVQSFRSEDEAVEAIRRLQAAGFSNDQISVIARDKKVARGVADDTGTDTKAEEGAVAGAVTGGALGAIAAVIAGASAVVIPGIGLAIGGPIAAAIAGAAGGGLLGGLVGMGIPEDEASHWNERFEAGDILVSVIAGARAPEARNILHGDRGTSFMRTDRMDDRVVNP